MPEARPLPYEPSAPPRRRISGAIWWFGFAATSLVAVVLTLGAYAAGLPPIFDEIRYLDKVLHFALAGALAFFLDGVLRRRMVRAGGIALPLAAIALLVPFSIDEFLQRFSANRSSSIGDFVADIAGVFSLIWLSRRLDR
jgi:VanZ family protein